MWLAVDVITGRQLVFLAAFFAAAAGLRAQTVISITSATDSHLTGSTLIDFETPALTSYTTLTLGGVSFVPTVDISAQTPYVRVDATYANNYNTNGHSLDNNAGATSSITINFTTPVTAFGFNFGASDTAWTLNAYDTNGALLGSSTIGPTFGSNAGEFYGLAATTSKIAKATLVVTGGTTTFDYIFIDNFRLVAVPEPSTLALLVLGLGAIGFIHRRRK